MENYQIKTVLNKFHSTTLSNLEKVNLMERTDIKFVFPAPLLSSVLGKMSDDFLLLDIGGSSLLQYDTVYFDTDTFQMYHDHHNGRLPRFKIRRRRYSGTGQIFLEVKRKNNKGIMKKRRIEAPSLNGPFTHEEEMFIRTNSPFNPAGLKNVVGSSYKRITLVTESGNEKCTFDSFVRFNNGNKESGLDGFIIGEYKSTGRKMNPQLSTIIKELNIKPVRFSKYCTAMLFTYPGIKYNNFKRRMLAFDEVISI